MNATMPMTISFGPENQPQTQEKESQMKQLLNNFNEVNRELIEVKKENEKLRDKLRTQEH